MLTDQNVINALNTVLSGVQIAQKRGAFSLEESATLFGAIKIIIPDKQEEVSSELETEPEFEEVNENTENDE